MQTAGTKLKRLTMLTDKLARYAKGGVYPMHMPGHKRNAELLPPGFPYDIDITEIHGFDDLHDPRGILRETAELAAGLYGSDKAFLLVNGSTVGILATIGAHASRGDKILVSRDCHRSVTNAAALFGLNTVFITPETDDATGIKYSLDPSDVETALKNDPDIKLAVVTSPSYEGVISDISSIAEIVHRRGIPLLVDSAHGAHLDFSGKFRGGAIKAGADVVVMSLHKTLPALTQCSLLHVSSNLADTDGIARMLSILQTSSPSYVLMASIDSCLRLLSADKQGLFADYERNLGRFNEKMKSMRNLFVLNYGNDTPRKGFFALDPGKLVIITKNTALSGAALADTLRTDHKIEVELACPDYAVAMTSICDTPEGFDRLADALIAIDKACG
jgi:arginine/lysine/ornithine decarboxylase